MRRNVGVAGFGLNLTPASHLETRPILAVKSCRQGPIWASEENRVFPALFFKLDENRAGQ
jgi:hypothetical protein